MTADETMTINERRKYLTKMQTRYRAADRQVRGQLLTEMEAITGMHRKSLTRLMAPRSLTRRRRRTQRTTVYGLDLRQIVRIVWESLDCICAERLTPQLLATAHHLARFGEITLTPAQEAQLGAISESTVTRMLRNTDAPGNAACHPALAAQRTSPGQPHITRRADGPHPLADDRTWLVRG